MRILAVVLLAALVVPVSLLDAQEEGEFEKALRLRAERQFESAMEVLQDILEKRPDDPAILLELAVTARAHAAEILSSASPTLGRLALYDAAKWAEKAAAAAPTDIAPLKLLGECTLSMAEYAKAVDAWRRASELDPADGEVWFQLGFSLGYAREFAEAIAAFNRAEQILGPDSRIFLNRGVSLQSLGQKDEAEEQFLKLVEREVAAGTPGSDPIRRAWVWLWKIHSAHEDFDAAEKLFAGLAEKHPELTSPWWYLAHARQSKGDSAGAADAFAKVVELAPTYLQGWQLLAGALVTAKRYEEAVEAMESQLPLDPEGESTRDLLISIARGMADSGRAADGVKLLTEKEGAFPNDSFLLEARGDLRFRTGRMAAAIRDYRRVVELDPFAEPILIKEQKAATALLRAGQRPADLVPLRRDGDEEREVHEGGVILDFETSEVFSRVNGAAEGYRASGEFVLKRPGGEIAIAALGMTLVPTLDTRPYSAVWFRVKGIGGTEMSVWAKDCYDEFGVRPGLVRLAHETPVKLTGEWQEIRLPLNGFRSVVTGRPIPFNRARLRMLLFDIGRGVKPNSPLGSELRIDEVRLVSAAGDPLVLADFEDDPEETIFLTDGAASAFAPTISRPEDVAKFRADPNTFVRPEILGDEYDPTMVHEGKGSYRLTLAREGPAAGELSFNPDRSYDQARAITFRARGEKGGERLRILIRDAFDDELKNPAPAVAPRVETDGKVEAGHLILTDTWLRYTIRREDYPDVDFQSLAALRFQFGTDQENPPGATIYLDSIRWE